ncbi:MAG TPA: hypothetical protein ENH94_09365 [Phycisphaerales bacterium]|nr:hypothetical protein [Phycisphaerales bacterium]
MTKTRAFEFDTKPSLLPDKPALSQNLFLRNEPNFKDVNLTATSCGTVVYNASQPKPKNGTNPNEANFFTTSNPLFSSSLWPSVFLFFLCGKVVKLKNKNMKNKANLSNQKFTANPCGMEVYNDLQPKTQNGTKPNKANFFTTPNLLFVRSFGFLQGASLRSSEVVQVVRRAMDDWLATPQGSKRATKTSFFSGEPAFLQNLFLRNKANFNSVKLTATSYNTVAYNTSKTKPKNGANPNKPNQSQFQNPQNRRLSEVLTKGNKPKQTQFKPNLAWFIVLHCLRD